MKEEEVMVHWPQQVKLWLYLEAVAVVVVAAVAVESVHVLATLQLVKNCTRFA